MSANDLSQSSVSAHVQDGFEQGLQLCQVNSAFQRNFHSFHTPEKKKTHWISVTKLQFESNKPKFTPASSWKVADKNLSYQGQGQEQDTSCCLHVVCVSSVNFHDTCVGLFSWRQCDNSRGETHGKGSPELCHSECCLQDDSSNYFIIQPDMNDWITEVIRHDVLCSVTRTLVFEVSASTTQPEQRNHWRRVVVRKRTSATDANLVATDLLHFPKVQSEHFYRFKVPNKSHLQCKSWVRSVQWQKGAKWTGTFMCAKPHSSWFVWDQKNSVWSVVSAHKETQIPVFDLVPTNGANCLFPATGINPQQFCFKCWIVSGHVSFKCPVEGQNRTFLHNRTVLALPGQTEWTMYFSGLQILRRLWVLLLCYN